MVFLVESVSSSMAKIELGQIYRLKFADVDGNTLITDDGHVSIIVLTTRANWSKALEVGDRVPDIYVGKPEYRLITVVDFGQRSAPMRALLTAGARFRLNAAAGRIQPRYDRLKINHDPRRDILAVADFDGLAISQLGVKSGETSFHVFVFDAKGGLRARWNDVPSADDLAAVLRKSS